jgi:16S rRNA (cytosine1402-N4)-methyltransferase
MDSVHRSVLSNEVIEGLALDHSDVVIDATINGGGHAELITQQLSDSGVFIGIDLDTTALELSGQRLKGAACQVELVHNSFKNLDEILKDLELDGFDKILFDLGWSSNQFETAERGFSFNLEGPLLMTLSNEPDATDFTAYDIVNSWEALHIVDILQGYGEERYASRIAKAIVEARDNKAIVSTTELADIIKAAVPKNYRYGKIHPATKTFQALRIAVNNEMEVLKEGLAKAFTYLNPGGRILVITFHSIEDRIVKHYFRELKDQGLAEILTKKPLTATDEELSENRRSRSAKLRIITKS